MKKRDSLGAIEKKFMFPHGSLKPAGLSNSTLGWNRRMKSDSPGLSPQSGFKLSSPCNSQNPKAQLLPTLASLWRGGGGGWGAGLLFSDRSLCLLSRSCSLCLPQDCRGTGKIGEGTGEVYLDWDAWSGLAALGAQKVFKAHSTGPSGDLWGFQQSQSSHLLFF